MLKIIQNHPSARAKERRGWQRALTATVAALTLMGSQQAGAEIPTGVDRNENVLLQWNDATLEAIRVTHPGPPVVARALAIVNTCAFDAWAAYDPKARGTRFGRRLKVPPARRTEANKTEAVAYGAYRAALDLFPSEAAVFRALLQSQGYSPDNATTSTATAAGIGNRACAAVLEHRHRDNANQLGDLNPGAYSDWTGYQPVNTPDQVNDPGRWQPLRVPDGHGGFVIQKFITPHWGHVEPYAIGDWSKTVLWPVRWGLRLRNRRVGPYPVDDAGYVEQAREIIAYSAYLTDQQKIIAEYWADGPSSELPPGHWNLFAQVVSQRDGHGLDDDVKMLFAMSNAVFDASIVIWGTKVETDYVRPVTAIHYLFGGQIIDAWGGPGQGTQAIDGNAWAPYQASTVVSPPFAEYPSGHSGFSSSAAEILRRFTGSDVFGASTTLPAGSSFAEPGLTPANDITLSWATFTDAADEAGISRRYGGIHFLDADLDGRLIGRRVADLAWKRTLYHFGERNSYGEYGRDGG